MGKNWTICGQKGDILPLNNISASEPLRSFRGESDPGGSLESLNERKGSDAEKLFNGKMSTLSLGGGHSLVGKVQFLPNTSPS